MPRRIARPMVGLACILLIALAIPSAALAHGGHTGPSQTFTQDFGPYEVAITIEIPSAAPAPLYLNVAPQGDMAGATMRFRVVPLGQPFEGAPEAALVGQAGAQGLYYTELAVDRLGDWELEARIEGPRGGGSARIPFTITAAPLPASSIGLLAALGGLVLTMLASIIGALVAQRRSRPLPGWLSWLIGQGMFACLIAAVIFGAQQLSSAIESAQASASVAGGRPHANLALRLTPGAPQAGQPLELELRLSDGSSGLPVEDLIPHHDALLHLVVVSADGGFFSHTHPPRGAPGRFVAAITPDRPGRYTAYAEIERIDSGTQVVAREFTVAGTGTPQALAWQGLGARTVAGMQVEVSAAGELRAGRATTLSFRFSSAGEPVVDMQPWLGMAGHLIARSGDGAILAHVHAVGPPAPAGAVASGVIYGPEIRFVYSFPQPGRYQVWGQFRRAGQVLTVPVELEVR